MRELTRRSLLATPLLLAGCGGLGKVADLVTDPAVGEVAAKVKKLVDGLALLPIAVSGAVPTGTLSKIKGWVADLGNAALAIAGTTSISSATPLVKNVGVIVNDIIAELPPGALPERATTLLSAVTTYLPLVLGVVGLFAAPHPGAARFGRMPPAEAERVLVAAAADAAIRR